MLRLGSDFFAFEDFNSFYNYVTDAYCDLRKAFDETELARLRSAYVSGMKVRDAVSRERRIKAGKINPTKEMESHEILEEEYEKEYCDDVSNHVHQVLMLDKVPEYSFELDDYHRRLDIFGLIVNNYAGIKDAYEQRLCPVEYAMSQLNPLLAFHGFVKGKTGVRHVDDLNADLAERKKTSLLLVAN